jgi:hypothetical protein
MGEIPSRTPMTSLGGDKAAEDCVRARTHIRADPLGKGNLLKAGANLPGSHSLATNSIAAGSRRQNLIYRSFQDKRRHCR